MLSLVFLAACGGPDPAAPDAGRDDAGSGCACDDGLFCNGLERCNADGTCAAGTSPCTAMQTCNEAAERCESTAECDVDGDGADSLACGGADCDDDDPARSPTQPEVCDAANVDEDCDDTTFGSTDVDDDGHVSSACCNGTTCGDDCDETRAGVHPGVTEDCNLRDDDCDGAIDEGAQVALWADADGDGFGDAAAPMMACPDTVGLVNNDDDCDDTEVLANPATPEVCDGIDNDCDGAIDDGATEVSWYVDSDGDGFGSATAEPVRSCVPVSGHAPRAGDCDDTVRAVNPGAAERCNGRDDNCDGVANFRIAAGNFEDDDRDGAADAMCPGGAGTDCNDTDAAIGPSIPDHCGDGVDNDCDSSVDEATGMSTWYLDADGDGWGDSSSTPITSCSPQAGRSFRGGDCDDADAVIHPCQIDGCDGLDVDCDGELDEDGIRYAYFADVDADGYGAGTAIFSCTAPTGTSESSGDCAPTDPTRHPGAPEDCNVADDDCDGIVDEGATLTTFYTDADRDGHGVATGPTRVGCAPPSGFAANTTDCDDGNPDRFPGALEACDGVDNDCNEGVDDSVPASACPFTNGTGSCDLGFCVLDSCATGFGNCDGNEGNGCETDTTVSARACGGCGMACGLADTCTSSSCDGSPIVQIAASAYSYCGRRANGRIVCWGVGGYLGDGGTAPYAEVAGITDAIEVAGASRAGAVAHSAFCAVTASGSVRCWGGGPNPFSPLALIPGGAAAPTPITVPGITDAIGVSVTESFGCAVRANQRIACWGRADGGALGNGASSGYFGAVLVDGISTATNVFVMAQGGCAVLSSGGVTCWGSPGTGSLDPFPGVSDVAMLGVSRTDSSSNVMCAARSGADGLMCVFGVTPPITGRVVDAEGGAAGTGYGPHACAVTGAGTVLCWGPNAWGQTGHGYTGDVDAIGPVTGIGTTVDVALGYGSTCALSFTGVVRCWGRNNSLEIIPTAPTGANILTPTVVPGL